MRRDRRFSVAITACLSVALVLSAIAWQSNPPREPVLDAAPPAASPWPDDYSAQLATIAAWVAAERTPDPLLVVVATQAAQTNGIVRGINQNVQAIRWPAPTSTPPLLHEERDLP